MPDTKSLDAQKQKQKNQINTDYIKDAQQRAQISDFVEDTLTRQANPAAVALISQLAPETYVRVGDVQEPPKQELGRKARKKNQKMRKAQADSRLAEQAYFDSSEQLERELDTFSGEMTPLQERTRAALQSDIPNLLSLNLTDRAFAPGSMSPAAALAVSEMLDRVSAVMDVQERSIILDRLSGEQISHLEGLLALRGHFAIMAAAGQDGFAEDDAAQESAQAVREYGLGVAAERVNTLIEKNMDAALERVAQSQAQTLAEHPEYAWMEKKVYLDAHRAQLARCLNLRATLAGGGERASKTLAQELERLADACGQLECKRQALAMGLDRLREQSPGSHDIAHGEDMLDMLRRQMDGLSRQMGSIENALGFLHQGTQLTQSAASLLAEHGYDAAAAQYDIADSASFYADLYSAKTHMRDRLFAQINPAEYPGYDLESFKSTNGYSRGVMMMNPDSAEESMKNLDLLIRVEAATLASKNASGGNVGKIPPALYNELKEVMKPYITATLSYDVRKLRQMPVDDLPQIQPELVELAMGNMMISDLCLKKALDSQTSIKEDLLAGNADFMKEYFDRSTLLNNYSALSRSVAILNAFKAGLYNKNMTIAAEHSRFGGADTTPEEDEALIREKLYGKHLKIVENLPIPDTDPVLLLRRLFAARLAAEQPAPVLTKFDSIIEPLRAAYENRHAPDAVPELVGRHRKLSAEPYRLAGTAVGAAEVPEPLFRNFTAFFNFKGVQEMRVEDFQQMLQDLSEGHDLTENAPPEQIEAARQKNMQGMGKIKQIMRRHYDYIARKYGTSLESMRIEEMCDHYAEINTDISNSQMDNNLVDRFPGFIDPENAEDVLLRDRVNYFHSLKSVAAAVRLFSSPDIKMTQTVQEIGEFGKMGLRDPDVLAALERLNQIAPMKSVTDWRAEP